MEKLTQAERAVQTLRDILDEPYSIIVRDATIQRFEYSSKAVWKAVREWLLTVESIEENHPRGCYRKLFQIGRIDEATSLGLLDLIEDRNRTTHAYIESIADQVYAKIAGHLELLSRVIEIIKDEPA